MSNSTEPACCATTAPSRHQAGVELPLEQLNLAVTEHDPNRGPKAQPPQTKPSARPKRCEAVTVGLRSSRGRHSTGRGSALQ
jgi:hypothetical protein